MNHENERPSPESVFAILADEHAAMLEAYLRVLMGSGADIDDVFQEAMIVAWKRLDDYDRDRPFGAWLRGIARVLVMKHARLGARRPATTDPDVLGEIDRRFDRIADTPGDTFREKTEMLLACVDRLPDHMRAVIQLVYMRGVPIKAAAAALDARLEAVKKRLQRGRALLAACMGFNSGRADA